MLSCSDCHSPHAVAGKTLSDPKATCEGCHGKKYDVSKIMPGTASTAANLFVATHTFNPNQARKGRAARDERDERAGVLLQEIAAAPRGAQGAASAAPSHLTRVSPAGPTAAI